MAIIKIGPPLSGIRGTIGGIVYSENLSSPYAKLWSRSSNPRTEKQTLERSYMSSMPSLWAALSDAQRAAWRTFSADPAQELTNSLGVAYYASGYNWFCKCNVRLLRLDRATIQAVPTQARPAAPAINDFRITVGGSESDICICGAASASTFRVGFEAAKAFDNNLAVLNRWETVFGQTTGWLAYNLCDPANVKRYRIYTGGVAITKHPKNWTFQVWSAGAWHNIHTVTNAVMAADTWYDFYCPNTYTETFYRINVSANNGHADYLSINEMEYYLADVESSVIIYPEDEFDNAPNYDLVLHISQGLSPAMIVQYPGFYEIVVNKAPGRWFQIFQDEIEAVFGTIQMDRSWFAQLYRQTQEGLRSAAQTDMTITIGG